MTLLTFIKNHWHVLGVASTGLIAFSTLRADVNTLQDAHRDQVSDHDNIVRIEEQTRNMEQDIEEIKRDLKEIAKAVKE